VNAAKEKAKKDRENGTINEKEYEERMERIKKAEEKVNHAEQKVNEMKDKVNKAKDQTGS
jgi:hypothetical protein